MKTQVEVKLVSIKKELNYNPDRPFRYELQFEVPYDPQSIYYQLSGGTKPTFNTTNQEVVDSMVLSGKYMITIDPIEE